MGNWSEDLSEIYIYSLFDNIFKLLPSQKLGKTNLTKIIR